MTLTETKDSTAWTPGPWVAVYDESEDFQILMGSAIGKDGERSSRWESQHILHMAHGLDPIEDAEQFAEAEANVFLAAAAPEMFDALKWAVEWMERYEGETMPEWREWAVRGRAALDAASPSTDRGAEVSE